jgi:peptidoglycan/xylan/chitin deacetylase (PgdA/CDA1 family)
MWCGERRCAVLLCFDFDAESLWLSKNLTTPSVLSRGEYGDRVGVPRILSLLANYSIRATFFVPAETARRHPETVKGIYQKGHEIAHHGDVHESPVKLDLDEEKRVLMTGLGTLEKLTGERPRGYRSPAWDLGPNSIRLLEEHRFLYDSSMMGDDFYFYKVREKSKETNLVEVPVSWELDDAPHFHFTFSPVYYRGMASPSKVYEIWAAEFEGAYASEGAFVLTMHPQIIGRYHRLRMLEQLIQHIQGHEKIWFTTCTEAVTDWLGRQT